MLRSTVITLFAVLVVLLSPVGQVAMPSPGTLLNGLELVFEHFLSGSYQTALSVAGTGAAANTARGKTNTRAGKQPRIIAVAPSRMLGFRSLLNFSTRQARQLVDEGYRNAREQLRSLM